MHVNDKKTTWLPAEGPELGRDEVVNALVTGLNVYRCYKYTLFLKYIIMPNLGIPGSDDKLWLLVACTLECGTFNIFALAEVE